MGGCRRPASDRARSTLTAPVWMASPPEVHSALLSSGPGPGPLLAAAGTWHSLSAAYAEAAEDLSALVAGVQAGAWEGPTAESYAAAHAPYVAWLLQAATDAAAMAARHETSAAAYTGALTAMPTLGELVGNHATHAALLATNFFGINTIPIAVNEADYTRMWIQAATTMTIYQALSTETVAAAPTTPPAPTVVKSADPFPAADLSPGDILNNVLTDWTNVVQSIVDQLFGVQGPPALDSSATFPVGVMEFLANPSPALLGALVFAATFEVTFDTLFFSPAALLTAPFLPLVGLAGLTGLAGLAAMPHPGPLPDIGNPIPESSAAQTQPPAGIATAVATPGDVGPSAIAAPAPASAPASAPAMASAPAAGPASFAYLVSGGGPDEEEGPTLIGRGKATAPAADLVAAAAAPARASTRERSQRRRQAVMRARGHEYMDIDSDLEAPPDSAPTATTASTRGGGPLGFTGTASVPEVASPEGLVTLADGFGAGATAPRLPHTWTNGPTDHPRRSGGPQDPGRTEDRDK